MIPVLDDFFVEVNRWDNRDLFVKLRLVIAPKHPGLAG